MKNTWMNKQYISVSVQYNARFQDQSKMSKHAMKLINKK